MKKLFAALIACVLCLPVLAAAQDEGVYSRSYARINAISGGASVQRAGDLGYEAGAVNLAVAEGDKLGTQDGRVEVQFGGRCYLRADRRTQVEFAKLPRQDNDPTKIHILSGSIYLRVGALDQEKAFEVHSPDASFYVLEEGLYRFNIMNNSETELQVIEGSCEAAGDGGSVVVKSRERLVASGGKLRSDPQPFAANLDDFGQWNESRDGLLARNVSQSRLPAELGEYESEFDQNGTWSYQSDYGYVWSPRISGYDWRPYYYGRWLWYPIIGWTWISDEPWGWAAYHYGRWNWDLGLGWFWIPTHHWGPAWVHWWSNSGYFGWCPLNYYNRPCVILNNHFYSHYNNRNYPMGSRALTVVRRDQLRARRMSDVALRGSALDRVGRVDLSARQPGMTHQVDRSSQMFRDGQRTFERSGVRSVERSFGSSGTSRGSLGRQTPGSSIRERGVADRGQFGTRSGDSTRVSVPRTGGFTGRETGGVRNIRTYPSQSDRTQEGRSSSSGRSWNPQSSRSVTDPSPRTGSNTRTVREYQQGPSPSLNRSRSSMGNEPRSDSRSIRRQDSWPSTGGNSASRSGSTVSDYLRSRSNITERSSRTTSPQGNSSARSYNYSNRSNSNPYSGSSRESRSYSMPRSNSYPSHSYSSPSRSSGGSSRSYSSPSRSYSSPSRSSGSSSYSRGSSSRSSGSSSSRSSSSSSSSGGGRRH